MRQQISNALLLLLLAVLPAAAESAGTPEPAGGEFQINTYTTDAQSGARVAAAPDGDFVAVWQSRGSSGSDSSLWSIQGQRYDGSGTTVGGEFQVNSYTLSTQDFPAVAAAAGGGFVVVWRSDGSPGSDSSGTSIQGQRFDAAGATAGDQFQVNTYTTGDQNLPAVTAAAGGGFAVVWESDGSSGSDSFFFSIQGQRFASTGATVGGQFQVNSYTTLDQTAPAVAAAAGGELVVVWESALSGGSDSSSGSIQGQRFDAAGAALGGEFQVNTYTTSGQFDPSVAAAAGGEFVVVWLSLGSGGSDTSDTSVQGQRFDAAGATAGDELQVNTSTLGNQFFPSVAVEAGGDFVVVWESYESSGSDSSYGSIQGQRFHSAGVRAGGEFQINTYTTNGQFVPQVAVDAAGDFVAVWVSRGSGGSDSGFLSIQGQRFGRPIFVDGFESGDTSVWSSAVP